MQGELLAASEMRDAVGQTTASMRSLQLDSQPSSPLAAE